METRGDLNCARTNTQNRSGRQLSIQIRRTDHPFYPFYSNVMGMTVSLLLIKDFSWRLQQGLSFLGCVRAQFKRLATGIFSDSNNSGRSPSPPMYREKKVKISMEGVIWFYRSRFEFQKTPS